ncbi:MAG: hypothetical protein PHE83_02545 [Opitutaceae bacterium]|nr:hypothetical protein [Opitutaceae bacterium]
MCLRRWAVVVAALGGFSAAGASGTSNDDPGLLADGGRTELHSDQMGLVFDRATGTLRAIENKLTGEIYQVAGDEFAIDAVGFHVGFAEAKLVDLTVAGNVLTADYRAPDIIIQVRYTLRGHFVEKQMKLTSPHDYGLKALIVSQPRFSGPELKVLAYRYPKYGRKPGEEPCVTYFLRSARGGLFAGTEVPFDISSVSATQAILAYPPSLKVKAQEPFESEPIYFGVYRKPAGETAPSRFPLRSESDAMVAMTSTILGPPRFGLVPMACGWHSQMEHEAYTEQSLAGDLRSLDFLAACGVDWVTDSHPWGGETGKMSALGPTDTYGPGPLVQKFLQHAQAVGVKVAMWGTMNNTHPWTNEGKPFRADQPAWLFQPGPDTPRSILDPRKFAEGNCIADRDFFDWIERINLEGLAGRRYAGWAVDGDFFGGAGWYTTVVRVNCQSAQHDHLPGDSTYACQRALGQLFDNMRRQAPDTFVLTCRPAMDLGVWMMRNVDACFTLVETGPGSATNLTAGDQLRAASRARLHYEFLPHYLDQPLLFPSWAGTEVIQVDVGEYNEIMPQAFPNLDGKDKPPVWPRGHPDYVLLSALSSSPNQLFYLPTKAGIPDEDRAEIRRWLDWGRKHVEYLKVRKDLPDWPMLAKVDGSAHLLGDHGFVFLFNPDKTALPAEFVLSEESIGLAGGGTYRVSQCYPAAKLTVNAKHGETIRWPVPAETALILEIQPER